jgi:hypothetical protein
MSALNGNASRPDDSFLHAIFDVDRIVVAVHEIRADSDPDIAAAAADLISDDTTIEELIKMLGAAVERIILLERGELLRLDEHDDEGD